MTSFFFFVSWGYLRHIRKLNSRIYFLDITKIEKKDAGNDQMGATSQNREAKKKKKIQKKFKNKHWNIIIVKTNAGILSPWNFGDAFVEYFNTWQTPTTLFATTSFEKEQNRRKEEQLPTKTCGIWSRKIGQSVGAEGGGCCCKLQGVSLVLASDAGPQLSLPVLCVASMAPGPGGGGRGWRTSYVAPTTLGFDFPCLSIQVADFTIKTRVHLLVFTTSPSSDRFSCCCLGSATVVPLSLHCVSVCVCESPSPPPPRRFLWLAPSESVPGRFPAL